MTSFEREADIKDARLNHATAVVVEQGATEGKSALRMKFEPTSQYPNVGFKLAALMDVRGYGFQWMKPMDYFQHLPELRKKTDDIGKHLLGLFIASQGSFVPGGIDSPLRD